MEFPLFGHQQGEGSERLRLNGELDTTPLQYGNKMTFGKVIREVARDRSKDVIDIRDVKSITYRGSKTHRSQLSIG